MFEEEVIVQAGWYPDPMGLPQLRWWNNHAWTELTTEAKAPLIMQEPLQEQSQQRPRLLFADDELPTRRQQREQRDREAEIARLATAEAAEHDAVSAPSRLTSTLKEISAPEKLVNAPDADEADLGFGEFRNDLFDDIFQPRSATSAVSAPTAQNERAPAPPPDSHSSQPPVHPHPAPYTAPAWIIALLPLLQLVVGLLILLGIGSIHGIAFTIFVVVAPYLLIVILAMADRALLRRAGHERTAHWGWAVLSAPVYLLVRSITLSRSGELSLGPLLVWVALGMLQIGAVLVVPGLLISEVPMAFSAQARQSVQSEASILGLDLTVRCPPSPPLLIGEHFGCSAKAPDGKTYTVQVSLQRANGWIDWRVDDWGGYTLVR